MPAAGPPLCPSAPNLNLHTPYRENWELRALVCTETFLALILILHTCETCKPTSEYDKLATLAGISISPDGTEDAKLYVRSLPDITVRPWQMEDTLDSDEEVEYMVADGADPCLSM